VPFQKGHAKFGGKVKGTKNKATLRSDHRRIVQAEAEIRLATMRLATPEEIERAQARLTGMMPLEVMLAGMRLKFDRGDIDGALAAAEMAAPYTSPKLSSAEVRVRVEHKSDAEVAAEIEALRRKIAIARSVPPMQIEATAEPVATASTDSSC
jgi:hypothetical protein